MNLLEIKNLTYDIANFNVINNFNLTLKRGEIIALFGPSGCGKTSILNLIAGFKQKSSGEINFYGKKISFVFQNATLIPYKTILDNILIVNAKCSKEYIYWLFSRVGLEKRDAFKYPQELSGGERQRVNFVRAIVGDGDIFLLDEAFSNLNYELKNLIIDFFLQYIKDNNKSAIIVTHDRMEAISLSQEIYFLEKKGLIKKHLKVDDDKKDLFSSFHKTNLYF